MYTYSSSTPFLLHAPSHPHSLDHSNYTWRRVQIMKLLIMQFLSTLPSPHPCSVQISSSALCSQTPSVYVPPLKSEIKFTCVMTLRMIDLSSWNTLYMRNFCCSKRPQSPCNLSSCSKAPLSWRLFLTMQKKWQILQDPCICLALHNTCYHGNTIPTCSSLWVACSW
jgi:hypothetical protein